MSLIDLFFLPKDTLRLSREDLGPTLGYHKRLQRAAEPFVDSEAGPTREMLYVTPADAPEAQYAGYTLNGQQIIEQV